MIVKNKSNFDQELNIILELKDGTRHDSHIAESLLTALPERVSTVLKKVNAEYNALARSIGDRALPRISFRTFRDPDYFVQGIKHKWNGV